MKSGLVFDINEFALHDGPGIRTSVFFKGCPLRCRWCHNPEGLEFGQELIIGTNGCINCDACREICDHRGDCVLCGKCINVCPKNLIRFAATEYTSLELAEKIMKNRDFLIKKGGVTFSGGEPLAQHEFLFEVIQNLKPLNIAIETSGFADKSVFGAMLDNVDLVLLDIKHTDEEIHKSYTGQSNKTILQNLELLKQSGVSFEVRIPVIPGVNDDIKNMQATAYLVSDATNLVRVELLKYHATAGAKYTLVGKTYDMKLSEETHDMKELANVFVQQNIPIFIP